MSQVQMCGDDSNKKEHSGNACYRTMPNLLSHRLISKNVKFTIYSYNDAVDL